MTKTSKKNLEKRLRDGRAIPYYNLDMITCSFLSISLVMVGSYFVELPVCGDEAHATDGLDAAVGLQMELSAKSIHEHVDDSRVVLEVDAPHVLDNILTWADTGLCA